MYCKVVKFSELKDSWRPRDHIIEVQLDSTVAQLKKRQAQLRMVMEEVQVLQKDVIRLTEEISDLEART